MPLEHEIRWCIFTSAGDHNAIRLWLEGETPRKWDLVVGYYGDSDHEYEKIWNMSSHAFRSKGGKFQILKNFVVENPGRFDQYSYVWVCDDDIQMSASQINEAFALTEFFGFWVAQPSFLPGGKISHKITRHTGRCDYKVVNFIEVNTPIFRRDKLAEFLAAFDGSLVGWGVDHWYMNVLKANDLRRFRNFFRLDKLNRFAIIDKVPVINPYDEEKGGSEIERLKKTSLAQSDWKKAKTKYGLIEIPHEIYAYCKISPHSNAKVAITFYDIIMQAPFVLVRRAIRMLLRYWRSYQK